MYSQTYVIKQGDGASREAFFHCGEHCYSGNVQLDLQHAFERVTLKDLPALVPIVQRQQNNLPYVCSARKIPRQSTFCAPLEELEWARNFVISEVSSDRVSLQMAKLAEKHSWIDDESSRVYFELVGDTPTVFHDVLFIASRVYANGLRIDSLYFEGVIYLTLDEGSGEQPLLDVHFPDISGSGSGATLAIYDNDGRGRNGPWMKLSVWQAGEAQSQQEDAQADAEENASPENPPAEDALPVVKDISSGCYVQSYCILKSDGKSDLRKVMFRFGSWCYAGIVELVPTISLSDIPYVVPALRVQQKKLKFVSDASKLPSSSPFALAMSYAAQIQPLMEAQAVESEANLMNLAQWNEPTQNGQHWLEDDASDTFFEFACASSSDALKDVEMLATKSYNANGIVSISVYYGGNWYLSLDAGASGGDDFPLLDSKFPDFSRKGSGFNIQCHPSGIVGWPQLRKLSIWCSGGDQGANKELAPDVNSVPAESSDEVSGEYEDTPTQPDDEEEVSGSCTQAPTQPEGNSSSNPQPEEEDSADKLEERLKAMADATGEVAWDSTGKPASQTEEPASEEKVAPIPLLDCPEDGDIYAQLDWLDERLDIEIDGLKGYLKK